MRLCLLFESFFVLLLFVGAHAVELDCEFGLENQIIGEVYSCKAKRLAVTTKDDMVDLIKGDHLPGMTNIDVKMLHVDDQTLKFFPADVENFFPNLEGLKIVSSGLKALKQENLKWLAELQLVDFSDNEIDSLEKDLFVFNPRLKHILIDSNKIKEIAADIFEPLHKLESVSLNNNECIDESWSEPEDIAKAKERLEEKCSMEFSLETAKETSKNVGLESIDTNDPENDYEVETSKVTKITKITRVSSSNKLSLDALDFNDDIEEVSCDLGDAYWKYSASELYTCTVKNQPIAHSHYRIKVSQADGEKVKGLLFDDNKKIKFLPMNLAAVFPNLVELSVKNSFIESISGNTLEGLGKLKKLSFTNNDLTVIESGNFDDLTKLEELDLSEGNIRFVEEDAFTNLHSLKTLFLGGNKLRFIQPKTFGGLSDLRNISIELNHLTDLDDNVFSSNTKLSNIWLNGNKISIMSPTVFENLENLSYVDLQGNECIDGVYYPSTFEEMKNHLLESCASSYVIKRTYKKHKVHTGGDDSEKHGKVRSEYNNEELLNIVQNVEVIENVDGDNPEITTISTEVEIVLKNNPANKTVFCDIDDFYWSFSKETLSTCTIKDQVIDAKAFQLGYQLSNVVKGVNMGFNKMIKYLPENTAEIFPSLMEFSAQNSSLVLLSRKNFAGLESLKSLNLANNNIKFIETDTFDDLKSLEELDISSNNMEYIDENLFSKLKSLKTLRLGGNKLHFVHPKLFKNLRNLQNVSISNNHLSTLDGNLFKTNRKLENVWLHSNKIKSLNPNMFQGAKELDYVDLRDNKCIDSVYEKSAFEAMATEILKKCGDGYVLKRGSKSTKTTKKTEKKKKKPEPEAELKEVGCEYDDVFWPSLNNTLFTCVIGTDQIIDGPGYTISVNSVPYALPLIDGDSVQALSFANNKNIKFLPKNITEAFPNLLVISAPDNSIESISNVSFRNLQKLQTLNLSGNNIKSLEPNAFQDLTSLEEINLDDNELEYIEETTFTRTKQVRKLKMSGNKLKTINPDMFNELTELIEVSVEVQDPSEISDDLFKSNRKLTTVKLNGKSLGPDLQPVDPLQVDDELKTTIKPLTTEFVTEKIQPKKAPEEASCNFVEYFSIIENSTLFTCKLEVNEKIDADSYTVKPSPNHSRVKRLSLDNENVKRLPENLSQVFPNLIEISATNSSLSGVSRNNFDGLKELKLLNLSDNNILHIEPDAFEDLNKVEVLDLSDNSMEFIEETLFDTLINLKKLYLSANKLHYLHPKTFKRLENLEIVTLDDNSLSVVEPYIFRHNRKLHNIDLSQNKIETLSPKIIDHLKEMKSINLSGNNCIDDIYDPSTFDKLKRDIEENCKAKANTKDVICEFNSNDKSCMVSDQPVETPDYLVTVKPLINGSDVERLIFNGSHIKYLPRDIGQVFPNLVELSTVNTTLVSISKENFLNLPKLKTLKLGSVESIDPKAFEDLSSLKTLYIDTDEENIDDETFSTLVSLETFHFYTKAKKLKPKIFENLTELSEFELKIQPMEYSETVELETFMIKNNPKLKKFKVNENVIKDEPLDEVTTLQPEEIEMQTEHINQPEATTNSSISKPSKISTTESGATSGFERTDTENTMSKPEVTCSLGYADWPNTNSPLITCDLQRQAIDDPETVIKLTPYSLHIQGLKIEDNKNVKYLPGNIAESFPNLIQLSARNSSLETILKGDLDELKKLKILNLSGNKLESIEPETFDDLESLEELDLSQNQIEFIEEDAFPNLTKLKSLDLNGNKIHFMYPKTLENLSQLVTLNLEGNRLPEVTKNELYELIRRNLRSGSTTEKPLETIEILPEKETDDHVACSFGDTYWYFIDSNIFTCELKDSIEDPRVSIRSSQRNPRVQGLSFIDNKKIKFLPQNLDISLPNLIGISAFNSSLESIAPNDLKNLRKVKYLNLANNFLQSIPYGLFDDLTSLEELDLSNNQIEYLDESTFENLASLTTLYIGGNNLRQLPAGILEKLPDLLNISLENNMIDKIDPNLFRNNKNLRNVWLGGNKIKTLSPTTFDNMQHLEYVDLQGNNCIKQYFDEGNLAQLGNTIRRHCHSHSVQTEPVQFRPDTKPSIPRKPQEASRSSEVPKEILCTFNYGDWPDVDTSLYTCTIDEETILAQDTIKPWPYSIYVHGLRFNGKPIRNLPTKIGETFPNLIRISAKNSSLDIIHPDTFSGLTKLKFLDLSDNKLESITPSSLTSLSSLEDLNLSHNRMRNLDDNMLPKNIKTLNLGDNQLDSLSSDFFGNFIELTNLNIDRNNIQEIEENAFKNNQNLKKISLSGNKINKLSPKTFDSLPHLESINLEENVCVSGIYDPLSFKALTYEILRNCDHPSPVSESEVDRANHQDYYDVPDYEDNSQARVDPNEKIDIIKKLSCKFGEAFSSFSNTYVYTCNVETQPIESSAHTFEENPENYRVKRLALINNRNSHFLPDGIGRTFPNLIELVLQNSSLKTVRPENFKEMRQLKNLDLSRNDLKLVEPHAFDELTSLEELNLGQNNLKFIDELNIESLKVLNLNENKLSFIEPKTFSKLSELVTVNLTNNQLTDIDEELFKFNPKVENIDLSFNKIKSIHPEALKGLRNLRTVDFRQNFCLNQIFSLDSLKAFKKTFKRLCQPYEALKSSFLHCKRGREICERVSSSPKLENITKENEKLKAFIAKAEIKIRHMNIHQRKLRNALNYEKNLVRKFKQKVRNVEMENEQLKSELEKSSRSDEKQNILVDLNCNFEESFGGNLDNYTCSAENLRVGSENSTIGNIKGNHRRGKRDVDVTSLAVTDQPMKFLPKGLSEFFPHLTKISIVNSKMSKINRLVLMGLSELKELVIKGNVVAEIEQGSFDHNHLLEHLDLSRNRIHELPVKVFESLHNLRFISLDNNLIQSLSSDVIPDHSKIKVISVRGNKLAVIDPRIFRRLSFAETIDLTGNKCVDHKFSKDDGDDRNVMLSLFGEIAVRCLGDKNGFCNSK